MGKDTNHHKLFVVKFHYFIIIFIFLLKKIYFLFLNIILQKIK